MWYENLLRCPVCGAAVTKRENSLFCKGERPHCFDISAEGYVNLASSKESGGGDDKGLIAARTLFLTAGHYLPFAERIAALLNAYTAPGALVVDAGCGEGYYACHMAREGYRVLGVDLSKRGIRHAAKTAGREGLQAFFAVAGIFRMPVADEGADAVISLFAPIAEEEFLRILKPGGILITAGAGKRHLLSLKRVLYDTPRENEPRADLPVKMASLHGEVLRFDMQLSSREIEALFAMTPYYYRTSREGQARLAALTSLSCEAEMDIRVYQKV